LSPNNFAKDGKSMKNEVVIVDYADEKQVQDLIRLLDLYACDPMGGGQGLSKHAKKHLAQELSKRDYMFSLIAYIDDKPAGLANCIESFSTFACKPVINIHDMAVNPEYRGKGISQNLLAKIEEVARHKGSAKITLEVLTGNKVAMNAYRKFGFSGYELDPTAGKAEFWEKKLT